MTRAIGCLAILFAACVPDLEDGQFACSDGVCPEGFRCIGGRCRSGQVTPECSLNAHCDRGVPCTVAICLDGQCQYAAEDDGTSCENGLGCDGPDACREGACVGVGPVPCDPCDETLGCSGCGALGAMCCEGSFCFDGVSQCNDSNVCEACGAMGEACCNADFCSGVGCGSCQTGGCHPTTNICTDCGGLGAPCCALGTCLEGVCQDSGFCEIDVLCMGIECLPGTVCRRGGCLPCGEERSDCCADDTCNAGSTCIATKCLPCGSYGVWCCGYPIANDCGVEAECAWNGICVSACGGEGEPCCAGPDATPAFCDADLVCGLDPGGGGASCFPSAPPMTGT